jgi:hypothetical protein
MKRVFNAIYDYFYAVLQKKAPIHVRILRRVECFDCDEMKEDYEMFKRRIYRKEHCNICKCPIDKKTSYLYSKCPLNKWKE